jgi:hypothetical protein
MPIAMTERRWTNFREAMSTAVALLIGVRFWL